MTIRGKGDSTLLDTYETERRPIGEKNCDWGLFTFQNSAIINAAIGLKAGEIESNKLRFNALFQDSDVGRALRAQVGKVADLQNIEFSAHNIELGFRYFDGMLLDDGTDSPEEDPLGQNYVPCTRPGNRLPHAWIEDEKTGQIISTHDFVGQNCSFALITDEAGDEWALTARELSVQTDMNIYVAQIGPQSHHLHDWDDDWKRYKGIKKGGALLIRPDNFVAWRSSGPSKDGGRELVSAFLMLIKYPAPFNENRSILHLVSCQRE